MKGETFQDLITRYRKERLNKSVRETASLVNLHYTYLSRLENGMSEPSDEVLERMAKAFKLDIEEKAELFLSTKLTPTFDALMQEMFNKLGKEKAAEIVFRKSKDKKKKA